MSDPQRQQRQREIFGGFLDELDGLNSRVRRWTTSLPSDDYKALVSYLYWIRTELTVPQIAEMVGFTPPAKLNEIVDKRYPFPVSCEICKQSKLVHYNSRNRKRMSDYDREQLLLITDAGWQQRRAAFINGTYFQDFSESGYSALNWLINYNGMVRDGICDECFAALDRDLCEVKTLRLREIERCKTMPYREYLLTDHWNQFREQVIWSAKHRCQLCNRGGIASGITLNVHHRTYENLGNESVRDVVVLCQTCHHTFHETGRLAK